MVQRTKPTFVSVSSLDWNPPSHAELLARLQNEFGAGTFNRVHFGPGNSGDIFFITNMGNLGKPVGDDPLGYYFRLRYEWFNNVGGAGHNAWIKFTVYNADPTPEGWRTILQEDTYALSDQSGASNELFHYLTTETVGKITDWDNISVRVNFTSQLYDGSASEFLVDSLELVVPNALPETVTWVLNDTFPLVLAQQFNPVGADLAWGWFGHIFAEGGAFEAVGAEWAATYWSPWELAYNGPEIGGTTSITLADAALGADVLALIAQIPLADAAVGVDAVIISAQITLSDSAAGIDAVSISAQVPLTDFAIGGDLLSLSAAIALTNPAVGADSLSIENKAVDSATGGDSLSLIATVNPVDSAVGGESVTITLPLVDTAVGSDSIETSAGIVLSESAAGTDNLALENLAADAAVGADAVAVTALITLVDAAVGTDTGELVQPSDHIPSSDPGFGVDGIAVTAYIELADSAQGSDTLLKSFLLPPIVDFPMFDMRSMADLEPKDAFSIDNAKGGDVISIKAYLAATDEAKGEDVLTVEKQYPQLEAFMLLLAA